MQIVPAVSIISSTMITLRPFTSPMAVILPTTLAFARSLCEMMIGALQVLGIGVGPFGAAMSGAAIERSSMFRLLMYGTKMPLA